MSGTIQCDTHGEQGRAYVCIHLTGASARLGFNRNEPTPDDPCPDAWCDDCELIRAAHDGWNEDSEKLCEIKLVCFACYQRSRIRNTRTDLTLDDLAAMRWKCADCEEEHHGPCLDIGYSEPHYWGEKEKKQANKSGAFARLARRRPKTFLTSDYCTIENNGYFVRGVIELPILGSDECFRWGVWGSLKQENFDKIMALEDDPKIVNLPPMFSWLSNELPEYGQTLNLKMYARYRDVTERPCFELEPCDHPLAQEYHQGITPERVRDITMRIMARKQ